MLVEGEEKKRLKRRSERYKALEMKGEELEEEKARRSGDERNYKERGHRE